jgi:hypothetical protein
MAESAATSSSTVDPRAEQQQFESAVVERVFKALGPEADYSPGLRDTLAHALNYLRPPLQPTVVVDARAFFLGLLAAGRVDPEAPNTAGWFYRWFGQRLPGRREELNGALSQLAATLLVRPASGSLEELPAFSVATDLAALLPKAVEFAQTTVNRSVFALRHIVAAMMRSGEFALQARNAFGVELAEPDMVALEQLLIDRIAVSPEPSESMSAWNDLFTPRGVGAISAPALNPNRVSDFARDQTDGARDPLGTDGDAHLLAQLICMTDVTPLSVAIFGGWGSGKTTFMNRLDGHVRKIAVKRKPDPAADAPDAAAARKGFVRNVVQVRFNAWQFIDANLWTSLTAEFFDQLRAGGWNRSGDARHARLVEEVNQHVHQVSSEADASRQAAATSAEELEKARSERDEAAKRLTAAAGVALTQQAMKALGQAYQAERPTLEALGVSTEVASSEESLEAFLKLVREASTTAGQVRLTLGLLRNWRAVLSTLVAMILFVGAWAIAFLITDHWKWIASGTGWIASLVAMVIALKPAWDAVQSIARRGKAIADAVNDASDKAMREFLQSERSVAKASEEAQSRQAKADAATRAAARYIDPKSPANPPRILRYLLEDDPDTKALEKEIGLIGRTRRLFQAVDQIVRKNRDDEETPDRIVIYIDDLDRCTKAQVYHALQATQLLLAFESFVVVVGVDVEWVQQALQSEMHETELASAHGAHQRTMDYLEKIFQIAFWLAPLRAGEGEAYQKYVLDLAGAPASDAGAGGEHAQGAAPSEAAVAAGSQPEGATPAPPPSDGESKGQQTSVESDSPPYDPSPVEVVQLSPAEARFLASREIAALASATPRGVKRLVNIYRLVRAKFERAGGSVLGDGGRPPNYPMIALCVAIETGQAAQTSDAFFTAIQALAGRDRNAPLTSALQVVGTASPQRLTEPALGQALSACPGLPAALLACDAERGQPFAAPFTAREALVIATLARRFSFNGGVRRAA